MKISATLILLLIASLTFLKGQNSSSGGTKIDEAEKKRLENQFKSLKTYYISDDGLVVYQPSTQPTVQNGTNNQTTKAITEENKTTTNSSPTQNAPAFGVPVVSRNNSQNSSYLINEENTSGTTNPLRSNRSEVIANERTTTNASPTYGGNGFVKKAAIDPISSNGQAATTNASTDVSPKEITNNSSVAINNANANRDGVVISSSKAIPISEIPVPVADRRRDNTPMPVQKAPIEAKSIAVKEAKPQPAKEVAKATQTKTTNKNLKKGDIFKKKVESSYSSLEEAALASEAILEKLQSQSKKGKSSGSISERIAIGAKKPLRKEALDPTLSQNILLSNSTSTTETSDNIIGSSDIIDDKFGDQPTYYINGMQVDKSTVDKLKSKDIIRRQTKTRNIKSGNPNGEVWIDTY